MGRGRGRFIPRCVTWQRHEGKRRLKSRTAAHRGHTLKSVRWQRVVVRDLVGVQKLRTAMEADRPGSVTEGDASHLQRASFADEDVRRERERKNVNRREQAHAHRGNGRQQRPP